MQNEQQARRLPLGVVAGLSITLLAATGVGAWWVSKSLIPSTPPALTSSPSRNSAQQISQDKIQVYWLDDVNGSIHLVPTSISLGNAKTPQDVLELAFNHLLEGPDEGTAGTGIPQGTTLHHLSVESDGVHVNLSQEFTSGGGSSSMMGRLGQVIYTASSLDPAMKVWINVDGKPLEVLGGEGIVVDQPMTRRDFEENFQL